MVVVVDVVCDGRSERILGALLLAAACVHAYVQYARCRMRMKKSMKYNKLEFLAVPTPPRGLPG